jgi:hypothetical protein
MVLAPAYVGPVLLDPSSVIMVDRRRQGVGQGNGPGRCAAPLFVTSIYLWFSRASGWLVCGPCLGSRARAAGSGAGAAPSRGTPPACPAAAGSGRSGARAASVGGLPPLRPRRRRTSELARADRNGMTLTQRPADDRRGGTKSRAGGRPPPGSPPRPRRLGGRGCRGGDCEYVAELDAAGAAPPTRGTADTAAVVRSNVQLTSAGWGLARLGARMQSMAGSCSRRAPRTDCPPAQRARRRAAVSPAAAICLRQAAACGGIAQHRTSERRGSAGALRTGHHSARPPRLIAGRRGAPRALATPQAPGRRRRRQRRRRRRRRLGRSRAPAARSCRAAPCG